MNQVWRERHAGSPWRVGCLPCHPEARPSLYTWSTPLPASAMLEAGNRQPSSRRLLFDDAPVSALNQGIRPLGEPRLVLANRAALSDKVPQPSALPSQVQGGL